MKNFKMRAALFLAILIGVTLNSCENEKARREAEKPQIKFIQGTEEDDRFLMDSSENYDNYKVFVK